MQTTMTTTEKLQAASKVDKKEKELDLFSFLDTHKLTRAERSYYEKQYKQFKGLMKSITEWTEIVKFIHL